MDDRKYTEAQVATLNLWETWREEEAATYADMQAFYLWMKKQYSGLLSFPVPQGVDRWQEIRAWLNRRTNFGERS
jgi:hypothetical protein